MEETTEEIEETCFFHLVGLQGSGPILASRAVTLALGLPRLEPGPRNGGNSKEMCHRKGEERNKKATRKGQEWNGTTIENINKIGTEMEQ